MSVRIIIGKNFGDEGKGLAADFFAMNSQGTAICVRHNGGAQAGHTVDRPDRRFVFSQLSSASFRGVDTYWADSFMPDLFKLADETDSFRTMNTVVPAIFASEKCRCTYIGDVLINMILETSRGDKRHGSCGMGINEAAVRSDSFPLYLGDISGISAEKLYHRLRAIQKEYLPLRLENLAVDSGKYGEYGDMLWSEDVLYNAAEAMCRNAEYVQIMPQSFISRFDNIIFEGAQGLMLDELNLEYAPHLTSSRTGLYEPARILREVYGEDARIPHTEAVYVTRSYVTRHGAGKLPHEGLLDPDNFGITDRTNVTNEWQGSLRFAPHGDAGEFTAPVCRDISETGLPADISLFVTHLNKSGGKLITKNGMADIEKYIDHELFGGKVYTSSSMFSEDVKVK